jgi:aspartate racemase
MGNEARCLGLIGGLGPGATVHYYRELIAALEKQDRVPRMLIAHADYQHVYATVTAKDFDGLARYFAGLIASMAAGGAELSAIVAATPHICAAQLTAISPLPFVNMLTEVPQAVRARGLKRVALLGTRFTIETRMFGCLDGIDTVMPDAGEIDTIHRLYTDFVTGRGSDAQREELRKLAQNIRCAGSRRGRADRRDRSRNGIHGEQCRLSDDRLRARPHRRDRTANARLSVFGRN